MNINGDQMRIDEIRRFATGHEWPAGVSLILSHVLDGSADATALACMTPLSLHDAEYVIACRDKPGELDDHASVDFRSMDEDTSAAEIAFGQILFDRCAAIAKAVQS